MRPAQVLANLFVAFVLIMLVGIFTTASAAKPGTVCGNNIAQQSEACDGTDLKNKTCESLGFAGGTLSCTGGCKLDTSACTGSGSSCQNDLTACTSNLDTCNSNGSTCTTSLSTCQGSLASCQLNNCGNGVAEFGEQCDGQNLQGQTCQTQDFTYGKLACSGSCTFDTSGCTNSRFVDNGDGTVTDNETELVWEKKVTGSSSSTDSRGVGNCVNCVGDEYNWTTATSEWISALDGRTDNSSTQSGFAGHTNWRLPTIVELQTIVDTGATGCGSGSPCIDPIFGPTASSFYWSASTNASSPVGAGVVVFLNGSAGNLFKTDFIHVRAVRTGP